MVFAIGMTVWRKGPTGWHQGRISGQVFDHDCWYVTTEPGSTFVAAGRQLRPATGAAPEEALGSVRG